MHACMQACVNLWCQAFSSHTYNGSRSIQGGSRSWWREAGYTWVVEFLLLLRWQMSRAEGCKKVGAALCWDWSRKLNSTWALLSFPWQGCPNDILVSDYLCGPLSLGKPVPTKTDEFSEKFQTAVVPPPHFRKIMLRIFSKIHDQNTPL